jgi:hypothetical protein
VTEENHKTPVTIGGLRVAIWTHHFLISTERYPLDSNVMWNSKSEIKRKVNSPCV